MKDKEIKKLHELESNWWFRAKDNLILSMAFELPQNSSVLDVGCGNGRLLKKLSSYFDKDSLHGVDPSSLAVKLAKSESGINIKKGDIENLDFAPSHFDQVIASDVLEHIEDDNAAYDQLLKVLKPKGRLILTVPAHQWLWSSHDEALAHKRRYSSSSFNQLLERENIVIEKTGYFYGLLFPIFVISRSLDRFKKTSSDSKHEFFPDLIEKTLFKLTELELKFLDLPFGSTLYAQVRKK